MKVYVVYVSGHGFGHATRTFEVLEQILERRPASRIVLRSHVPEWLLRRSAPAAIDLQIAQVDTGMVQIDSLVLDEEATARRAAAFYRTFEARVAEEHRVLSALQADVVIGDVPPLAFPSALAAGIPSCALSNFTWDWIYEYYPRFDALAPGVVAQIGEAYRTATLALRMPFAGGFASMAAVTRDIPLVARRSRLGRQRTRQVLDLPVDRPIVLASFGGHSTTVPYEDIARRSDITLLLTDWETRSGTHAEPDNLHRFSSDALARLAVRYEDLVAAADVVVSKPGYGIVSECVTNDTALLYTSRGAFAENDVLVEQMARVLRCRFIPQALLRAGEWQESITALMTQPLPAEHMRTDGGAIAADAIIELAERGTS